ncbi:MAG: hypothetical protein ABR543_03600 [Gemmatimonadaceae bacterium]
MAEVHYDSTSGDPVGIIISRGKRDETLPLLAAYVWGPAPEVDAAGEPKAA